MRYLFYKVAKDDIYKIKFILEAYENMMSVSTVDDDMPKIQISVAPDFLDDARAIIDDLKTKMYMKELSDDPTVSQGKY
jgi:hypothetical protein